MYQRTTPRTFRRIGGQFRPNDHTDPAPKYRLMESLIGSRRRPNVEAAQDDRQPGIPLPSGAEGAPG
jgi:hypothetical protein